MKPLSMSFVTLLVGLCLSGCTTFGHGLVSSTMDDGQARVKLGSADGVVAGERVNFVNQECNFHPATDDEVCDADNVGTGTVVKVLNEHESIVRRDSGTIEPGMSVEPVLAH